MALVTREQFARELLRELRLEPTKRRLWALLAWMQAEGGNARFNPLNTTLEMPGATNYNSVGVKEYVDLRQGVIATAKTLNDGARRNLFGYRPIRRGFVKNFWASRVLLAVERSKWGTGGLALLCLPLVKVQWDKYRNLPIGQ